MTDASRAAEMAARGSYGKILALVSSRTHDIAAAEDALADAFAQALTDWPRNGVPRNQDAWLLTVARNRLTDRQRRLAKFPTEAEIPDLPSPDCETSPLGDKRLELMMVCAHEAIAPDLHTPLMLQTVLGIDAKVIAQLFMISPAALSKRLVRAKAKIRDTGTSFAIPEAEKLAERSASIFEAIYALHAHDWLDPSDGMGEEALYLANLACDFLPGNAEILGLAALIAFNHARRNARVIGGVLVPTEQQDMTNWDDTLIAYGKRQLHRAFGLNAIGRFQIEAAIDEVHLARKDSGRTDWEALNVLYHASIRIAPSWGALVSQAVITANVHGVAPGLAALASLQDRVGTGFQPLWAARAELLARSGAGNDAIASYDKAISLATDMPVIRFLQQQREKILHPCDGAEDRDQTARLPLDPPAPAP